MILESRLWADNLRLLMGFSVGLLGWDVYLPLRVLTLLGHSKTLNPESLNLNPKSLNHKSLHP